MVYVPTQKAFYCNSCGAMKELTPEAAQALQDYERSLTQPPAFSLVDGTPIQSGAQFDRYGRSTYATPGGITIPKHPMSMVDKLRYEKQGLTQEMDAIFRRDDERLQATGRTIIEDKLELNRSNSITSSDELKAEKSGSVGLKGSAEYNPAMRRRTRLSS
jgi:hypothetical protein